MKKRFLSLAIVASFLMTFMTGTMAFAAGTKDDEAMPVLTENNAVLVENGLARIISNEEAETLLAEGREAEATYAEQIADISALENVDMGNVTRSVYEFEVLNQATAFWGSDQVRITPYVVGPCTITTGESHTFTASFSGSISFSTPVIEAIDASIELIMSAANNTEFTVGYSVPAGETGYVLFTPRKRTTVGNVIMGPIATKVTVVDPVKVGTHADGIYQLRFT